MGEGSTGVDGREYPWGDGFDPSRCNTDESGIGKTTPVGKYSPRGDSPYDAADMAGNVWEWCADWYDEDKTYKMLRGGAWRSEAKYARCTYRLKYDPVDRYELGGFRYSRGLSSS